MDRVLIVDDHPMVRDGLRTVIVVAFDGCEVFEAASLDEALEIIDREGDFDLVLLDINMPGSSGVSGLSRLRRTYPALPVAVVSAAEERGLIGSVLTEGAAGFIPKSLKRGAIVDALRTILAGEIFVPDELARDKPGDDEFAQIWARIDTLTPQQRVVLVLLVAGKLNKQIAYDLDLSMTTVKAHVSAILAKMKVFSRTQAVILATKAGFVGSGPQAAASG